MSELVLFKNRRTDGRPCSFDEYRAAGGYEALATALRDLKPEGLVEMVLASGLRGRGGAGFPTGRKWQSIKADAPHPRYIQLNTDEMEPGTFKDRALVNADPHLVIEGIILSAYAVRASRGVFFIRPSYEADAVLVEREIKLAREAGLLGKNILGSDFDFELELHRSAGRYICGEASAQTRALMGRRPNPDKTAHLTERGLWGQPTVVNNVETLALVPHIIRNGVEWFKGLAATPAGDGTKLYCVSGKVARPGCFELPMGTPLGDIIFENAGGMRPGAEFKACLPGGSSTGYMTSRHLRTPMDFESLKALGRSLGTGSIIVFDHDTCLVKATANIMRFFVHESCGWCTPCREGLPVILDLLETIDRGEGQESDLKALQEMSGLMRSAYCGLAPGAIASVQGLLDHFEDEIREHLIQKRCPFDVDWAEPKPGAWNEVLPEEQPAAAETPEGA